MITDEESRRRWKERDIRENPFGHQMREPDDWKGRTVTDYERMLNSYEWYERSQSIKDRDKFICQECESQRDLQVHHRKYTTHFPWDEPGENLVTLCAICHHAEERKKQNVMSMQAGSLISGLVKNANDGIPKTDPVKRDAQIEWARDYYYRNLPR